MDKSRSGGGAARVPKRRHGRVIVGGPSSRAVPPPQNASARGKARPPTVRCADGANKESEDKDSDDDDSDYHDCDGEDSDSSDSDSSDSDDEDSEDSDSGDGAAEAGAEASANNGAEDGANNGAEDGADDGAGGGGGGGDGPPLRKRQTLALREIKHYQQSTKPLIAKAPFERVVREVAKEYTCGEVKFEWTPEAFRAMQEGAEAYLVEIFQDAQVCAVCREGKQIIVADIQQARRLRGIGRC